MAAPRCGSAGPWTRPDPPDHVHCPWQHGMVGTAFGGAERVSELVLGIDVGTSRSKGVLARPDGAIVAVAERPHALSLPRPGWAEHDAITTWWADFLALSRELLTRSHELGGQIVGLCV